MSPLFVSICLLLALGQGNEATEATNSIVPNPSVKNFKFKMASSELRVKQKPVDFSGLVPKSKLELSKFLDKFVAINTALVKNSTEVNASSNRVVEVKPVKPTLFTSLKVVSTTAAPKIGPNRAVFNRTWERRPSPSLDTLLQAVATTTTPTPQPDKPKSYMVTEHKVVIFKTKFPTNSSRKFGFNLSVMLANLQSLASSKSDGIEVSKFDIKNFTNGSFFDPLNITSTLSNVLNSTLIPISFSGIFSLFGRNRTVAVVQQNVEAADSDRTKKRPTRQFGDGYGYGGGYPGGGYPGGGGFSGGYGGGNNFNNNNAGFGGFGGNNFNNNNAGMGFGGNNFNNNNGR